jgi:hypothetical protein
MAATLSMRMSLSVCIVLVLIDRPAHIILPLIDLLMLLPGQMSAIRHTISRSLVIDARLAVLEIASLVGGKLAGSNSLANALLLILRPYSRP